MILSTNLKFYTSVGKGLKLKVTKFSELIHTFVEVTGEKLVGGGGEGFLPLFWIELKQDKFRSEALRHIEKSCKVFKIEQFRKLKTDSMIQWQQSKKSYNECVKVLRIYLLEENTSCYIWIAQNLVYSMEMLT